MTCVERSYLCQLRLGILPIAIETGRYKSIPLPSRLCEICNENVIEDEIHILFHCTKYEKERKIWYRNINLNTTIYNYTIDELLNYAFQFPRQLAKYLCKIIEVRRNTLYEN